MRFYPEKKSSFNKDDATPIMMAYIKCHIQPSNNEIGINKLYLNATILHCNLVDAINAAVLVQSFKITPTLF